MGEGGASGRRVAALLLAAGGSSRMGELKQLMDYHGRTFVEACAETILASSADALFVVVGYRADEVASAVARLPARIVENAAWAEGMSSSVKAGVRAALAERFDAVLVALCDQPHVPVAVFDAVLSAYRETGARIVVPAVAGDSGHPALFDLALADAILAVDPSRGLREVTYANRSRVLRVAVDTLAVVDDVDTPDDYERIVGRER